MLIRCKELIHNCNDIRTYFVQAPGCVDDGKAIGFRDRELQIAFSYAREEVVLLLLKPVGGTTFPGAFHADIDRRIQQNGQVWPDITMHPVGQLINCIHGYTPPTTLVGTARV